MVVGDRDGGFTVVECYFVGINTVLAAGGLTILVAPSGVVAAVFIDKGGEQARDVVEVVVVGGRCRWSCPGSGIPGCCWLFRQGGCR